MPSSSLRRPSRSKGDIGAESLSDILDDARPDVAADILRELSEEQSQVTLEAMESGDAVVPLLEYADDSAGGEMNPGLLAVKAGISAANALDSIRLQSPAADSVSSVFVVDDGGRLVGTISVIRLALSRPASNVGDIMDADPVSVSDETDREECARIMERYDLRHLGVVDADGKLLGEMLIEAAQDRPGNRVSRRGHDYNGRGRLPYVPGHRRRANRLSGVARVL